MPGPIDLTQLFVGQFPEAIIFVNESGLVVFQNATAKRLFGFEDVEIIGKPATEVLQGQIVGGADGIREIHKLLHPLADDKSREIELLVAQRDGAVVQLRCTFIPLTITTHKVGVAILASVTDGLGTQAAPRKQSNTFLEIATELGSIGLFDYNLVTGEMIWNDSLRTQFGIPAMAEVSVDSFLSGVHPADRQRVTEIYQRSFDPESSGGRTEFEYRVIGANNGIERWLIASGRIFYRKGRAVRHIGATIEITQRKQLEMRLREAALHDPLTGLPNRRLLVDFGTRMLEMSRAHGKRCAVLFVDVDRFKLVNDIFGHDMGDQVLKDIAARLANCVGETAMVCRLGGDEFIVLLPDVTDTQDAELTARLILGEMKSPLQAGSSAVPLSASIGISLFPEHGEDLASLVRCADLAMYASKQAGRGAYALYTPCDRERAEQLLQAELQLRRAIEAGSLNMLYQPIVRIDDGKVVGAEALIRATGFHGRILSPDVFIPIAEKTGQIKQVGLWVTHEVCRQLRQWREDGWTVGPVAINVSAYQLSESTFADEFLEILDEYGVATSQVHVEVTESAIMINLGGAIALLTQLRGSGVMISLDDFGTGYSSLSQLSKLPLDKLKIDQSFISRLQIDPMSQAVTDTIIGLGRRMNLQLVAEGIESQHSLDYLRERGCNQAQGFFFSKPLAGDEFKTWCDEHSGGIVSWPA